MPTLNLKTIAIFFAVFLLGAAFGGGVLNFVKSLPAKV